MKDRVSRKMVNDRIASFEQGLDVDAMYCWEREPHLDPDQTVVDKARPQLPGSRSGKKAKIWRLEFQWKSVEDCKKYSFWYRDRSRGYTDAWHKQSHFISQQAVMDHIRSLRPQSYYDPVSGRNFRIRNIQTGEIIPL